MKINSPMKLKYSIIYIILFLPLWVTAQGIDDKLEMLGKINRFYYDENYEVKYDVKMIVFSGGRRSVPVDSASSSYSMVNGSVISEYDNVKIVMNKQYYVTLVEDEKAIMVGRNSEKNADPVKALKEFQTMVNNGSAQCNMIKKPGNEVAITIIPTEKSSMDSLQIVADVVSGKMMRLVFFTSDNAAMPGKVVINLRNQERKKATESAMKKYQLSNYVVISGKSVTAASAYRSYEIYNSIVY